MYGNLPINSSAAGGPATGNFMPTPYEALVNEMRRNNSSELMEHANQFNPRTRFLAEATARAMSGATSSSQLNEWLNYTRGGMFARSGATMVQGMMGSGSFVDMAYGLQQAVGGGGMRLRMPGNIGGITGGGMATDIISRQLFDRMSNYYFDGRGLSINARTMGRDPTELGRMFNILGASGALSGMDASSFGRLSITDRLRNVAGNMRYSGRMNEAGDVMSAIDEITSGGLTGDAATNVVRRLKGRSNKFLASQLQDTVLGTEFGFKGIDQTVNKMQAGAKEFMKLHDTLKDLLGNIEDVAVLGTSFNLTGINTNSISGYARARASLERMKHDASALGVGSTTYMSTAQALAPMFGQAFGSAAFGASMSNRFLPEAFTRSQDSKSNFNLYGIGRPMSPGEVAEEHLRDVVDISNERGGRIATQLAYSMENNDSLKNNATALAGARKALIGFQNAAPGAAKDRAIAVMQQQLTPYGFPDFTNQQMLDQLSKSGKQGLLADVLSGAASQTVRLNYKREARGMLSSAGSRFTNQGGDLLYNLDRILGQGSSMEVINRLKTGDMAGVRDFLKGDQFSAALNASGMSADDLLKQIEEASGGNYSKLGSDLTTLGNALDTTRGRDNLTSIKQGIDTRTASTIKAANEAMVGGDRTVQESVTGVIARLVASGGKMADITSQETAAYISAANIGGAGAVMEYNSNKQSFNLSEANLKELSGNKKFMSSLGISTAKELADMATQSNSASSIMEALRENGYSFTGDSVTGKDGKNVMGIRFYSDAQAEQATSELAKEATRSYYESLGVNLSPSEINTLSKGQQLEPDRMEAINKATENDVKTSMYGKWKDEPWYLNKAGIRDNQKKTLAENTKKAIYGQNKESAAKILYGLEHMAGGATKRKLSALLHDDDTLKKEISQQGIDVSEWDDKSLEIIQNSLEKISTGKVSEKTKSGSGQTAGGQNIGSMNVQELRVTKIIQGN